MPENAEATTVEEPLETRRRGRVAALVLALAVLVLAAPFASSTVRTGAEVRWLAHRMCSEDRAVREEARHRLLEIGRPTIDPLYVEIVSGAVDDFLTENARNPIAMARIVIFVGHADERTPLGNRYAVETTLRACNEWPVGANPVVFLGASPWPLPGLLTCRDAKRELVVAFWRNESMRDPEAANNFAAFAVAVDDDLSSTLVDAVKWRAQKAGLVGRR